MTIGTIPTTTSKSTVDVLREGRELISDPARWTTGFYARDAEGSQALAHGVNACSWCATGAVGRDWRLPEPLMWRAVDYLDRAAKEMNALSAAALNDTRTHADVLAMFDRAIALAEGAAA